MVKSYGTHDSYHQIKIKTGGTEFSGTYRSTPSTWTLFSDRWTINPNTGVEWTWDDIDNLQTGIRLDQNYYSFNEDCTQIYAVVNYSKYINFRFN